MHAPTNAARTLSYLKKIQKKGSCSLSQKINIESYYDADWTGSIDTRRSITRYYMFLKQNIVIWRREVKGRLFVQELMLIDNEYYKVIGAKDPFERY